MTANASHNPHRFRLRAVLPLGMLFAVPPLVRAQVSLATVVDLAERNSASVRIAEADVTKAQASYSATRDAIIPSIQLRTGLPIFPEVGFTGTPPSIISASVQSLVYGLPQKRYIDAAGFGVKAALSSLKDTHEQVALDASTAYIEMDTVNSELAGARQQEEYASNLVHIETERAEAGVDSALDLLQAQLTASQLKLARIRLEARFSRLANQLAMLTGMPVGAILTDHSSIPEIPQVSGGAPARTLAGVGSAQLLARSKQLKARGDHEISYFPQLGFGAQYYRDTTLLNSVNKYFVGGLPANNFSSGISIQVPLFDLSQRANARASAAEALRATVEAEQAERQNEIQIASLNDSLRELDALAEVSSLKQQIAAEQLKAVITQLDLGNGASSGPNAQPQPTPKSEQLARIDERQKYEDALDTSFDLAKARLSLLRALGHMEDWLNELHGK
jgi:outer membrane protein TolC